MRLLDLQIDAEDEALLEGLTLYLGTNGYVYYSVWKDGKSTPFTLHGLLMGHHSGMHIDHINGDKLDNRRSNLRVVTPQVNQINRKRRNKNNTSGLRGVALSFPGARNPWRAQITANGKNHHLGLFATKTAAIQARRSAELKGFGEFCP